MNLILTNTVRLGILAILAYVTKQYSPDTIIVGALATGATALAVWVWVSQLRAAGRNASWGVDQNDHPMAAIVFGCWTGAVLLIPVSLSVTAYHHFQRPADTLASQSSSADVTATVAHTIEGAVDASVGIDEPSRTAKAPLHSSQQLDPITVFHVRPVDDGEFVRGISEFSVDNHRVPVLAAGEVDLPIARNLVILRDLSASTQPKPFPRLIEEATDEVLAGVSGQDAAVAIWDFASEVTCRANWSDSRFAQGTGVTQPKEDQPATSLYESISLSVEEVARRKPSREVVLISDGANNVRSEFSIEGICSLARKNEVKIHVLALPTQDYQRPLLEKLAASTGGVFLEADADLRRIRSSFEQLITIPAYRLVTGHLPDPTQVRIDFVYP